MVGVFLLDVSLVSPRRTTPFVLLIEKHTHTRTQTNCMVLSGGYYTIKQRPRLRTIVLNTNYCARLNPWTLYDSVDPGGQLRWLVSELADAEFHGDKVHLVGHIAPDPTECTRPWLLNYLSIIERYQATIVASFFGHSHKVLNILQV